MSTKTSAVIKLGHIGELPAENSYLTVDATAKLLGVASRTVQKMFDYGRLTGYKITTGEPNEKGHARRIDVKSVLNMLVANGQTDRLSALSDGRMRIAVATIPEEFHGKLIVEPTLIGAMAEVYDSWFMPLEVILDLTTVSPCPTDVRQFLIKLAKRMVRFKHRCAGTPGQPKKVENGYRTQVTVFVSGAISDESLSQVKGTLVLARDISEGVLKPVVSGEGGRNLDRMANGPVASNEPEL